MIGSTFMKAHRTAASLRKKGGRPRAIGRTKGGLNSRLHMLGDGKGRPLNFFLSPGQMADSRGALVLLSHLPATRRFPGDKAYDADRLRDDLESRGIRPCIPPGKKRRKPARYDKHLHRKRYRIENASGRLKDWRGIATRYERCGDIFLNAIILTAIVIFWPGFL